MVKCELNLEEQAETEKCKLKRQSASQNDKVSKHKLKCQSAKVQIEIHIPSMFKGQNAS